jgi:voltage-gated potassium channel
VGYGDKYPVTNLGRIIGTILMISGVGLFGTYTAYIASLFVRENNKEESRKEQDE